MYWTGNSMDNLLSYCGLVDARISTSENDLPETKSIYVSNMFSTCSELGIFMYWTGNSLDNLLSYCGLVDARISTSEKDLPVKTLFFSFF